MVDKCNETHIDPSMKKFSYIGVLDIAGFEILITTDVNKFVSTMSMRQFF